MFKSSKFASLFWYSSKNYNTSELEAHQKLKSSMNKSAQCGNRLVFGVICFEILQFCVGWYNEKRKQTESMNQFVGGSKPHTACTAS